jgi:hypothetical protein
MPNPYQNKKKVRGWKRQIRKLQELMNKHLALDLISLEKYGCDYVKIWIDPWDWLVKRNPPLWFRRLILEAFIEVYDSWNNQLLLSAEPFYLKIWLFEPRFHQTQVVAAVGQRMKYYDNLFTPEDQPKRFPYESYEGKGYNLHEFEWDLHVDEEVEYEREEELDEDYVAWLKEHAWRTEKTADEDTLYAVKYGNVWVGSRRNV